MNHIDNLSRQIHASHVMQSTNLFLGTPLGRKIGGVVVIIITLGVYLLTAYWYSKRFSAKQLTPPQHLPPVHQPSNLPTTSSTILPPALPPRTPSTITQVTPLSNANPPISLLPPPALPPRTPSTRALVTPPHTPSESTNSPVPALLPRTPSTRALVTPPHTPSESTTPSIPAPLPRPQDPPSDPNQSNNSSSNNTLEIDTSGPGLLRSISGKMNSRPHLIPDSPKSRPGSGNYDDWDNDDKPAAEQTNPISTQQPVANLTITTTANSEITPVQQIDVEPQSSRRTRRSRPTSDDWNVDYRSVTATSGLTIGTSSQQQEANSTDAEVQQSWPVPKPQRKLSKKQREALDVLRAYQEESPQPPTSPDLSSDESDDLEKDALKTRSCPTSPPSEPSQFSGSITSGINLALSTALSARRIAWDDTVAVKPSKTRTSVTNMFEDPLH